TTAGAELAGAVVAPAPQRAVGLGRARVLEGGGHGRPVGFGADLERSRAGGVASVTELTVGVVTEAVESAVGLGGAGVAGGGAPPPPGRVRPRRAGARCCRA